MTDATKKMIIDDLVKLRDMLSQLSYDFDDFACAIETDLQALEEEGDD